MCEAEGGGHGLATVGVLQTRSVAAADVLLLPRGVTGVGEPRQHGGARPGVKHHVDKEDGGLALGKTEGVTKGVVEVPDEARARVKAWAQW